MIEFKKPFIMGVLNVTPDSFSDGGEFFDSEKAIEHGRELIAQGAQIIDVGGESTRPGAQRVSPEEEQRRVMGVIAALSSAGVAVSIDTMNASTAAAAVGAGASIINDVSGGLADPQMFNIAADTGANLIISHWRGFSDVMDTQNDYQNVAKDVAKELQARIQAAIDAGVQRDRIIVDPGLGFAKDLKQNWQLVAKLDELEKLGYPILVGASRKRFIAGVLEPDSPAEADNQRRDVATAVLTALLLQRKLWGVRVHNVQLTADTVRVVAALREAEQS